jgi:hypothetical protein
MGVGIYQIPIDKKKKLPNVSMQALPTVHSRVKMVLLGGFILSILALCMQDDFPSLK